MGLLPRTVQPTNPISLFRCHLSVSPQRTLVHFRHGLLWRSMGWLPSFRISTHPTNRTTSIPKVQIEGHRQPGIPQQPTALKHKL
jgi:hypothetical protein